MKKHNYILGLSITYALVFFLSSWVLLFYLLAGFLMKNSSVEFVTYHGDGYTVNYPKGWTIEKDKDFGYINMYGNGGEVFFSTYDGSKTTLSQQLDFQLNIFRLGFKNFKQIENKKIVNLHNGHWLEAGGICDLPMKDGTTRMDREMSVATAHMTKAGSLKLFTIDYVTDRNGFSSSEQKFFLPMWQSFRFL